MDVKELRRLLRLMRDFELSELEIEEEGLRVRLKRGVDGVAMTPVIAPPAAASPAPLPAPGASPAEDTPERPSDLIEITSPMVGTFYSAPDPESPAFVAPGTRITQETTVCIIEAMKVFNEIKAEVTGTIEKILVKNEQPVEYGQPMFLVRPD